MTIAVDAVRITFHAIDAGGHPVTDLRPDEIDLFDGENGPTRFVDLERLTDRSIHAGILIDTSGSVAENVAQARIVAAEAARGLLASHGDSGFAAKFERSGLVLQGWTNDIDLLLTGISGIHPGPESPVSGTGLFDVLSAACLKVFGTREEARSYANVLLLFSDGEDTASHATLQETIQTCQGAHTAIYALGPGPVSNQPLIGAAALRQLSEQTGGKYFRVDQSPSEVQAEVGIISSDVRNEYTLLYRPKKIPHDGAFHPIGLVGPKRVASIAGPSGFYAPVHRTVTFALVRFLT